jgi:hypothetical protein
MGNGQDGDAMELEMESNLGAVVSSRLRHPRSDTRDNPTHNGKITSFLKRGIHVKDSYLNDLSW